MNSIWSERCRLKKRSCLENDLEVDILVVGAGIAGILTAYSLMNAGRDVVIIDGGKSAGGNTKNTTAKITSQHGLIYNKLLVEFGENLAKQYALANESAIQKYKDIISEKSIDCDFEEKAAYIYSKNNIEDIKNEVKAANKLGIHAEFIDKIEIPINIEGAVKFNNQAQFNPLKFLEGISEELVIYENTRAVEIDNNIVITEKGKITANHIIIATHYPIINMPGYYFLKMHQERSYVIALQNAAKVEGMYLDSDKNGYSFRNYKDFLLLGAIDQRTGENSHGGCYEELRRAAKEMYPNSIERYHWSAQDCMTIDGIPYIGRYSDKTPNIYVATGFNKWGMTSSMVASMIISDIILDKKNNFSQVFSPNRFDLSSSIKNIAKDMGATTKNFLAQKVYIPSSTITDIKNGHGGIIECCGEKVGVYKDNDGKAFVVSTKCTHLGCQLNWNPDELTWDCPCHGSRFNYKGELIDGPSMKNLLQYEIE